MSHNSIDNISERAAPKYRCPPSRIEKTKTKRNEFIDHRQHGKQQKTVTCTKRSIACINKVS